MHAQIRAPMGKVQDVLEEMAKAGAIGGFKVREMRNEARELFVYGNDGEEFYPFRDRMERIFREMGASGIVFPEKGTKWDIGRLVRYRRDETTENFTRIVPRGSTAGSRGTGPETGRAAGATGRAPPGDTGTGSGSAALVPRAVKEEQEQGQNIDLVPLDPDSSVVQGLTSIGGRFLPLHATPLTKKILAIRYAQDESERAASGARHGVVRSGAPSSR
ncbi:MAG: hypothetical protein FJ028_03180 [Chloroflexi bacterium]|nr:hypothetical protein [Chloroflexota bacterium]